MEWKLADPLTDVEDIIEMADGYFVDTGEVLKKDKQLFRKHLTVACTVQVFDRSKEFIAVCRDGAGMVGYCWFDR